MKSEEGSQTLDVELEQTTSQQPRDRSQMEDTKTCEDVVSHSLAKASLYLPLREFIRISRRKPMALAMGGSRHTGKQTTG